MKVAIVFESMFGNTEALAGDVLHGLAAAGADASLAEVADADPRELLACDLVVLAAPTHALTLSRPLSRADAVAKGADPLHATTGLREWLITLRDTAPPTSARPAFAVFDTRVVKARHWPGSAARSAVRTLRKSGFAVVDRTSFYVEDITGPVAAGEHERAREWGRSLTGHLEPHVRSQGAG